MIERGWGFHMLIGGIILCLMSCKDEGSDVAIAPPGPPGPVSFANQVQPILTASCVNPGCHPGGGAPFSLREGQSYALLVNVAATTGPCAGLPRVKPNSADSSALFRRIQGTCGDRMPLGASALPESQRNLVRDWINQGALQN